MMRYFTLSLAILTLYLSTGSARAQPVPEILPDPPCETTTCISFEAIALSKHAEVFVKDLVPRELVDLIWHYTPCAEGMSDLTGIRVLKQMPGELELFADTFCTIQGCVGDAATSEALVPLECVN